MKLSRIAGRWLAWPVVAVAVALLALGDPRGAAADPVSEMSAVGPGVPQDIDPGDHSQDFIVDINVNIDDATFQGYQYRLDYDQTILTADSVNQLEPLGMVLCNTPDLTTPGTVKSGCNALAAVGVFTGTVEEVTFHCIAQGASLLTLVDLITDSESGSTNRGYMGATIATTLFSDSVTCLGSVGGIAELPELAGTPLEAPDSSGPTAGFLAGIAAAVTAGLVTLGGAGWYARRRWLR